jgi:hypothetical protein
VSSYVAAAAAATADDGPEAELRDDDVGVVGRAA